LWFRSFPQAVESIWRQRRLVFIGFSFTDPWIRAVAQEGLFAGTLHVSAQHISLLGLREETLHAEVRRAAGSSYGAEVLVLPDRAW